MKLPKITPRQKDILDMLYDYRFLNRIQIQKILEHKDYKTINLWLKDLREKEYVNWIYSTHFAEKTKPAIYYLGINAIRYFRQNDTHPAKYLHKYYKEADRSQAFIDRCSLIADYCIEIQKEDDRLDENNWFYYETETEYIEEGDFNFLVDSDIHPHLCYLRVVKDKDGENKILSSTIVEVFDPTLPRYSVRRRLKNYVKFLDDEEWQSETDDDNPPRVRLICSTKVDMIYCKRATKRLFKDLYSSEEIKIQFTYIEAIKKHGLQGKIWEEVRSFIEEG